MASEHGSSGDPSACVTPANCLESSTLRCVFPIFSPLSTWGLGCFSYMKFRSSVALSRALVSRGKREDQMLGGIYLCVVIVGSLWAGVVKRLGFSKHRSWSLELAGDNSFLKRRKPPIPQHMFRDLGRPQGNFPEDFSKTTPDLGKMSHIDSPGVSQYCFYYQNPKFNAICPLPPMCSWRPQWPRHNKRKVRCHFKRGENIQTLTSGLFSTLITSEPSSGNSHKSSLRVFPHIPTSTTHLSDPCGFLKAFLYPLP